MPSPRRPTQQRPRHQRAFLRCAQCGADPQAHAGKTDTGLMIHTGSEAWKNVTISGKCSPTATVGPSSFRNLWHHAIAARKPLQSLQSGQCNSGQPGHQDAAASGPNPHQPSPTLNHLAANSAWRPLDDSPLPNSPVRDSVITERDRQLLADFRRASAMATPRSTVSRYAYRVGREP